MRDLTRRLARLEGEPDAGKPAVEMYLFDASKGGRPPAGCVVVRSLGPGTSMTELCGGKLGPFRWIDSAGRVIDP